MRLFNFSGDLTSFILYYYIYILISSERNLINSPEGCGMDCGLTNRAPFRLAAASEWLVIRCFPSSAIGTRARCRQTLHAELTETSVLSSPIPIQKCTLIVFSVKRTKFCPLRTTNSSVWLLSTLHFLFQFMIISLLSLKTKYQLRKI